MVDPYDWLGLPKIHRPPTPYQILQLPESVSEAADIRAAADRQFRRILPHMSGENALDAEQVWTEIEEARDLLLDADRRASYDAQMTPAESEAAAETPADEAAPDISADWEEPAPAAVSTGAEPWWKNAGEAPAGGEDWWKQPLPTEAPPAPPPAPAIVPLPNRPVPAPTVMPSKSHLDPEVAEIGLPQSQRRKRRSPLPTIILLGLIVTAAIAGGAYYVIHHKSEPTQPKDEPSVAAVTKQDLKPKRPDRPAVKDEDPLPETPLPKDFSETLKAKSFKGHTGAVNAISVSASGTRFASVGTDKTLRLWSIAKDDSALRHTFISPAVGVVWCDKDRRIFAADGLTLAGFDATKSAPPTTGDSPRGGVTVLAADAAGSKALTGLTDGYVRLWDSSAARPDEWAVANRGPITAVDLSRDGSQALAAVSEGPITLWNMSNRTRVHEWTPHPAGAIAVRFSPDGARAATAGPEGTATIYDLAGRKEICRLDGHIGPVTGIAWLPDGRQVATVGVDGTARLWSAETGQPLRWQQTLNGNGNCLAVDPAGRFILTGSSTGVIELFPLPRVKSEDWTGTLAKAPSDPLPLPASEAVAAAMADVRKELAKELGYTRADDLAILADNLRRRSSLERVSLPLRFGLLQEARMLAVKAGDPLTAFKAIEELAAWFDLDELAEKAASFAMLPEEADGRFLLNAGLEAAERAELDGRPEVINRLLARLPDKAPAGPAGARLTGIRQRAGAASGERKAVLNALSVLKNAPDEQGSNHTYGTFLCFARQDWSTGLPHLAKGTDPRLIDAAKLDLSAPADPKERHRLGEMWYGLALEAKDHRAKRAMLARARIWFELERKSPLGVTEDIKAKARIDDIAKLDVPSKDANALPSFTPIQVRRAYNTAAPEIAKNEWRLEAGAEIKPEGISLPSGSPVLQSRFGLAPGSKLTLTFLTDGRELRITAGGQETAFAGSGRTLRLVIQRSEDKLMFAASVDGAEPVSRTIDILPALRGPLFLSLRLTGTTERAGGWLLTSAILRGPASLPLPVLE